MSLTLTEEQKMLKEAASEFMLTNSPLESYRKLRDNNYQSYDPKVWETDALFKAETKSAWRKIIYLGLTDALRVDNNGGGLYSYWDYRAGAWNKDQGIRIDHLLLSPNAADVLLNSGVDRTPRGWEKPSDHTPVWCELDI